MNFRKRFLLTRGVMPKLEWHREPYISKGLP
ncbi:hypothetical protein SAG0164_01140 [Streptococcus agalactiae MRI Z1-216]|uniref:Uncharacterized protein n=1 Tax=Streptococcus agalactiae MRI Z1-216 TaxID=1154879 RepID=A0AAD3A2P6_STRAG|nr:hypothetical protein SAG0164_01140 [Streptococcus agalactiae MRI Z1-216]EPW53131.1 hypothetical protein SAG0081_10195 [Streptococcus agalactiae LMG 15081]